MMMATTFSRPNDPGSHAQSMLRKSHSQVFLVLESKGLYLIIRQYDRFNSHIQNKNTITAIKFFKLLHLASMYLALGY